MSPPRFLDSAQALEFQEALFTTNRQQLNRSVPIPLPRPDFWNMVAKLLSDIELDIQDMLMSGVTGMRLQNEQKRQANVRQAASDLARKRLVAMTQHMVSQKLRAAAAGSQTHELPSLDWQRHDPAEKAFYTQLEHLVDRFKMDIDFRGMQEGLSAEGGISIPVHKPGTTQLDQFTRGGLTNAPPPALVFEDNKPEPIDDYDIDEEDRMIRAEWPDIDEHIQADLETAPIPQAMPAQTSQSISVEEEEMAMLAQSQNRHAAAMELAPSKNKVSIDLDSLDAPTVQQEAPMAPSQEVQVTPESADPNPPSQESGPAGESDLVRIRVVQSFPDPIMTDDGEELTLEAGDVHFLNSAMAQYLIDSGVAQAAAL